MNPIGESRPRTEPPREHMRKDPGGPSRGTFAPTEARRNIIDLAREKKLRREADAGRAVEIALKAVSGDSEALLEQLNRRIRDKAKERVESNAFDQRAQDEYEFLLAQREALRAKPQPYAWPLPERKTSADRPTPAAVAPEPTGLFGRLRSGWDSFKTRLFSPREPAPLTTEQRATQTRYEKAWTEDRRAQREPDRQREVRSVQEIAAENLEFKRVRNLERLVAVNEILDRRSREPLPANIRARYVEEAKSLRAIVAETARLLRIYDATKKREDQLRKAS